MPSVVGIFHERVTFVNQWGCQRKLNGRLLCWPRASPFARWRGRVAGLLALHDLPGSSASTTSLFSQGTASPPAHQRAPTSTAVNAPGGPSTASRRRGRLGSDRSGDGETRAGSTRAGVSTGADSQQLTAVPHATHKWPVRISCLLRNAASVLSSATAEWVAISHRGGLESGQ